MRQLVLALTVLSAACVAAACASSNDGTTGAPGEVPPGGAAPGDQGTSGGGSSASSASGGTSGGGTSGGGTSGGGTSGGGTSGGGDAGKTSSSGGPVHVGPANIYPDPKLTPGAAFPNVTAATICQSGYPATVRNVTSSEKAQVFARYGLVDTPGTYEVDHFISLELGGSNDVTNLWPQRYAPTPGAHEKDGIESTLHAQLCNGKMTLAQVQAAITTDWYAVYLNPPK